MVQPSHPKPRSEQVKLASAKALNPVKHGETLLLAFSESSFSFNCFWHNFRTSACHVQISKASTASSHLHSPALAPQCLAAAPRWPLALLPGSTGDRCRAAQHGGAAARAEGGVAEVDGRYRGGEDAAGEGVGIFGWDSFGMFGVAHRLSVTACAFLFFK